ncbi:MAG: hypothetical protein IPL52_00025 [Flavobacteriales bacterium]|nr:hypothetical protein [Flavobacteriales bacterium]
MTARRIEFVFSEEDDKEKITYWSFGVSPGRVKHSWRYPQRPAGVRAKLYIYNTSGLPFSIKDLRINITHVAEQD